MGTDRKPSGASKLGNMVGTILLLLLGASLAMADPEPAVVGSDDSKAEGAVLDLDSDSLDKALAEGGLLMLDFYAPWCGHCKKLEPEYEKAALDLARDSLVLGKVDCDANEVLCRQDRWDIEGFPAVKVVRGSIIHDYRGPRFAPDIAAFMRQVAAFGPEDTLESLDGGGLGDDIDDEDDDDFEGDDDDDDEEGFLEENGMLVLGLHDFDRATEVFGLMLVIFHKPGCKGCAELEPEYVRASDELYKYRIPVAKVDCFAQKELCEQTRWGDEGGVDGKTPSLFAVREGKVFEYGDRPLKRYNMVPFVKNLAGIDEDYKEDGEGGGDDDDDDNGEVDESNVLKLDSSTIEAAMKENDVLLLEFYAPWCGNCQRLEPRYAKAANKLVGKGVRLAKVDCMENNAVCMGEPWRLEGYPTLFLSKNGKTFRYEGRSETKDIVEFMLKAARPSLKVLNSKPETEAFILNNEIAVLGLFQEENKDFHKNFLEVAKGDLKLPYGVSFNAKEVHDGFGMVDSDEVLVFKDFDEMQMRMSMRSFTTEEDIKSFVRGATRRLVLKMGSPEALEIMSKRPLAMIVLTEDEEVPSPATLALLEAAKALAKAARHPITYVHATLDAKGEGVFAFVIGEKNRKGNVPSVALVAPSTDGKAIKYLHKGELTLEGLQEFERKYFAGELEEHLKSEALSARDDAEPVKVVKGQSFKGMVVDNDDDVLLEFYAPWCGHCDRLEPIYKDLAAKLEGRDKLVIAKMDTTANDIRHPGVMTNRLPAIYFFKAGSKDSPEAYGGTKDAESLEAFINEKTLYGKGKAPVSPGGVHSEL